MKNLYFTISLLLFFTATTGYAQLDSIQYLEEVILQDTKLKDFSEGYKLLKIQDSILRRNSTSLTDVLLFNSSIYFKENGYGMVSSASFRGTNAAHTAVVWNGIAINSVLTGQTDFNTISPILYDDITVRSGGGSTQYGSGAIGGSVHLNNDLQFKKKNESQFLLGFGSFSSLNGIVKTLHATKNNYLDVGVHFVSSQNDYKFIGKNKRNTNGEFSKLSANTNLGHRFKKNTISFHSNYYYGNRNFSSSLTTSSKDNYKDISSKNLLSWSYASKQLSSTLKAAHLFEKYRYFPDKEKPLFFHGKATTLLGNYTLDYKLSKKIRASTIVNYTNIVGKGSGINNRSRNTLATILLLKYQISHKLVYNLNVRKEYLNGFDNPLLFALDANYKANDWYTCTANASKNYRVPSFNDLYWETGGNKDLQPETSLQAEIGNLFSFKKIIISVNGFYIKSIDLIQWRPNQNNIWTPINISEVTNYGLESKAMLQKNINKHFFQIQANYSYTKAINLEKNKQLIYVPFHKATGILNYRIENFSAYFQALFNGKVFTTTDNKTEIPSYFVSNLGVSYDLKHIMTIGFKANNIFNRYYENVAYRPMPNRNLQLFIKFKI